MDFEKIIKEEKRKKEANDNLEQLVSKRTEHLNKLEELRTKYISLPHFAEEKSRLMANAKQEFKEFFHDQQTNIEVDTADEISITLHSFKANLRLIKDDKLRISIPSERIHTNVYISEPRDTLNLKYIENELELYTGVESNIEDIQVATAEEDINNINNDLVCYNNALNNFDDIKFVYSLYDGPRVSGQYKTLTELLQSL